MSEDGPAGRARTGARKATAAAQRAAGAARRRLREAGRQVQVILGVEAPQRAAELVPQSVLGDIFAGADGAAQHRQHTGFQLERLLAGEAPGGLPERLVVFGISSLPQQSLEVLDVPTEVAVALADAATPGLLTPFLAA